MPPLARVRKDGAKNIKKQNGRRDTGQVGRASNCTLETNSTCISKSKETHRNDKAQAGVREDAKWMTCNRITQVSSVLNVTGNQLAGTFLALPTMSHSSSVKCVSSQPNLNIFPIPILTNNDPSRCVTGLFFLQRYKNKQIDDLIIKRLEVQSN